MPFDRIRLSESFRSPAKTIFEAWLEGESHAEMTGSPATGSATVGSKFTAWDGYISGKVLEVRPYEKIVMSWRTSEFSEDDADSRLEVRFVAESDELTEVVIIHSDLPEGTGGKYDEGWSNFYFEPMRKTFGGS